MMGRVCHAIVDDVGDDKVFLGSNKKRKDKKIIREKCPYGAYTCQGPQGSVNIRVTIICLNTAPNDKLFIYMHVYAFVKNAKGVC